MVYIKQYKRIIIPMVVIFILLIIAVSVLPWWSDINITLHGVQL